MEAADGQRKGKEKKLHNGNSSCGVLLADVDFMEAHGNSAQKDHDFRRRFAARAMPGDTPVAPPVPSVDVVGGVESGSGEGGGGAHAEGLQTGHEGDGAHSKCRNVRYARHRDREAGVCEGEPESALP